MLFETWVLHIYIFLMYVVSVSLVRSKFGVEMRIWGF